MDEKIINMDKIFIHPGCIPRRFGSPMPIDNIGFLPEKRDRVVRVFESYNFSFILRGRGDYQVRGQRYEVVAPCVLTQWPGEPMNYGPDGSWHEVYFIYSAALVDFFRRRNFFVSERPIWYMSDAEAVLRKLRELRALMPVTENTADRVDLICEAMVVESLLAEAPPPRGADEEKIRAVANQIKSNFVVDYDYDDLARTCGMSPATFRRQWLRYIGVPPARYRMQLAIREACRLLAETPMPIKEVAFETGFDDPLYFSRRFHLATGCTPTEYRDRNQPYAATEVTG